jgi:hypothetical protein
MLTPRFQAVYSVRKNSNWSPTIRVYLLSLTPQHWIEKARYNTAGVLKRPITSIWKWDVMARKFSNTHSLSNSRHSRHEQYCYCARNQLKYCAHCARYINIMFALVGTVSFFYVRGQFIF